MLPLWEVPLYHVIIFKMISYCTEMHAFFPTEPAPPQVQQYLNYDDPATVTLTVTNDSAHVVTYFSISVVSSMASWSTFATANNTIKVPVLYNQEYNISLVANNCAGSSEPVVFNLFVGKVHFK